MPVRHISAAGALIRHSHAEANNARMHILTVEGEPVAAVTNGSRCAGPIQKRFNSDITVSATLCSTWLPTGCDAKPNEVISNGKLARKLKPLLKGGLPLR